MVDRLGCKAPNQCWVGQDDIWAKTFTPEKPLHCLSQSFSRTGQWRRFPVNFKFKILNGKNFIVTASQKMNYPRFLCPQQRDAIFYKFVVWKLIM
jgi:hypothetical protein